MEAMEMEVQKLNNKAWIVLFFISVFHFSCQIEPGFEENTSLGSGGWPEKQKIVYDISQIPETGEYDFQVLIRQDNNYPFYNCFLLTEITDQKGKILKKGLAEAFFYDQKTGKPKGQGLGDLFSHQYTIFDHLYLKKGSRINIKIRQFMRRDTLQGIVSVGYALKPLVKNGKN